MSRPGDGEQEEVAFVRGLMVALVLVAPWWIAVVWWLLCQPLAWWLVS